MGGRRGKVLYMLVGEQIGVISRRRRRRRGRRRRRWRRGEGGGEVRGRRSGGSDKFFP